MTLQSLKSIKSTLKNMDSTLKSVDKKLVRLYLFDAKKISDKLIKMI